MRSSLLIAAAAVVGLLAPLPLVSSSAQADGAASRPDVMPVKDIRPGMKGYGLTVFRGTQPERFDVEVIDVLDNFQPRQDLILIKTHHPRLEVARVVAGMSGSPIYINDKMIGAYAYGWTFPKESVAGVTPIRTMLDELARPLPKSIYGWPLKMAPRPGRKKGRASLGSANGFVGLPTEYDLAEHAKSLAGARERSVHGALKPVSTPLLMGGLSAASVDLAKQLFEPLGMEPMQAGGSGRQSADAPEHYVDGGAIGVQLVRGDMSAMGLGTVTRVEGDSLVAFGHPMMQAGATALPTAVGRVLWFMATSSRSFKIGTAVRQLGAMVNDRPSAIVVSESAQAPVIPVRMKIHGIAGLPQNDWKFEVAHERFMAPSLVAMALGEGLQASASERQDVSWKARTKLGIVGHGVVEIEDFGVSSGGTPSSRELVGSNLVSAIGGLLNNPWEPVLIESVDMDIEMSFAREILRLRGVEVLTPEVEAGQAARLKLTLEPYEGQPISRIVSVPMPANLAGKTVSLSITPGYREERDRAEPENLEDFIGTLEDPIYPPQSIVVSYSAGDGAVAYRGHVAKRLPPGALDSIRPRTSSVAPSSFASEVRQVVPLSNFVFGGDRVQVSVKPVLR